MKIKFAMIPVLLLPLLAAWGLAAQRQDFGGGRGAPGGGRASFGASAGRASFGGGFGSARRSVVINMGHPVSGWGNRNFPRNSAVSARPSWGQVRPAVPAPGFRPAPAQASRSAAASGWRSSAVVHHHVYSPGYVRKRLQKVGVTTEPRFITDRAEMIHTDRAHSTIKGPKRGPDGRALNASLITPRGADAKRIGARMALVSGAAWQANVERWNRSDTRSGHYYWHDEGGLNTCHYRDASGYQWYGWYDGGQCFWTRNFAGRWWWYDADYDRWAFYNDNFWWWQDPYHVGDLYCYNDGSYIAVNSQDDQVGVSLPSTTDFSSFNSPDGSRTIRVVAGSEDAFLYDNSVPQAFDPVYLASGVQRVEFSDPSNGRPMEIVLKLEDQSYDLFDGDGHTYNPGAEDSAAASEAAP